MIDFDERKREFISESEAALIGIHLQMHRDGIWHIGVGERCSCGAVRRA